MEVISTNKYASFTRRLIAFFIDEVILRAILGIVIGMIIHAEVDTDFNLDLFEIRNLFTPKLFITELLVASYFIAMESSVWQATIGKRLMNIKVTDVNYSRIDTGTAVIRYVSKYLSTAILLLGYIWVLFDDRRQGWHDKLANTFVINI
jgi:uncharacterized RDD family membrane protein YckC